MSRDIKGAQEFSDRVGHVPGRPQAIVEPVLEVDTELGVGEERLRSLCQPLIDAANEFVYGVNLVAATKRVKRYSE